MARSCDEGPPIIKAPPCPSAPNWPHEPPPFFARHRRGAYTKRWGRKKVEAELSSSQALEEPWETREGHPKGHGTDRVNRMPIEPLWVGKIITVWGAETAKSPRNQIFPA